MNPFERLFSPKKEDDHGERPDQMPESILPEPAEVPITPEIRHTPEEAKEIIRKINEEEEGEKQREHIIDEIIEERDHKKSQMH